MTLKTLLSHQLWLCEHLQHEQQYNYSWNTFLLFISIIIVPINSLAANQWCCVFTSQLSAPSYNMNSWGGILLFVERNVMLHWLAELFQSDETNDVTGWVYLLITTPSNLQHVSHRRELIFVYYGLILLCGLLCTLVCFVFSLHMFVESLCDWTPPPPPFEQYCQLISPCRA